MKIQFNTGDIVRVEMRDGIYQVIKKQKMIFEGKESLHYYIRKIITKKLEIKIGKAFLIHESWLFNFSQKKMDSIKELLEADEIQNIIFEPDFIYSYYLMNFKGLHNTAYFYCKKTLLKEINDKLTMLDSDFLDLKKVEAIIRSYCDIDKLHPYDVVSLCKDEFVKTVVPLKEDECKCRLHSYRYENDFIDNNIDKPYYRKARLEKIK